MFRSAVFKLTAWYVGALVLVCLVFSIPIYNVTATRLRSGAMRQTEFVQRLPLTFDDDDYVPQLVRLRDKQIADDQHQLLIALFLINAGIVGIGAYASFLFARRTLRPLERAHAAQVRFTADASHELRTPLAVMQTEIDVALRNTKLSAPDAREVLQSNLEEVARLRQLSDQLLSLTRASTEPLRASKVQLSKFIADTTKRLSKQYKILIATDIQVGIVAQADKLLIGQALSIIIENAVLYSGLPDPAVTVRLTAKHDVIRLAITNQGNSIAAKDLEHLFDRFYRGTQATSLNPKGHGLGLSLVKDIISRHGGDVSVTSAKKSGTCFTLTWPQA